MANWRCNNDSVYIDLWDETLTYNRVEFALYQLSEEFVIKIASDAKHLTDNRLSGKVLSVEHNGPVGEGHETSYKVIPWVWDNVEAVSEIIKTTGKFVSSKLQSFGISLSPNWEYINTPWLDRVKKVRDILSEANSNAFNMAAQNIANKYRQAYNEELTKDYGLNFGIISNSLTAHLLYAAQATSKELKDKARAEQFASEVTGNPMEKILLNMFNTLYPLYVESAEPALLKILSQYYSYIVSLFSNELSGSLEDASSVFDFEKSNGYIIGTSSNVRANILQALRVYPNNGNVIGYAIKNGVLDSAMCEYGKNASKRFAIIIKEWAVSELREIYNTGKPFNKPIIRNENKTILDGLMRYYAYTSENVINCADWQDILSSVYGAEILSVKNAFEPLIRLTQSHSEITDYAIKGEQAIVPNSISIELFVLLCNEVKASLCLDYANKLQLSKPIYSEQISLLTSNLNKQILIESDILKRQDEQNRQAEYKRQEELKNKKKKRNRKIRQISITAICFVFVAIITSVLITEITSSNKYNEAMVAIENNDYATAFDILVELDDYKNSKTLLSNIKEQAYDMMLLNAEIGDKIYFGSYEQDGQKENGKEDIEWFVLDKKDDKLLIISKHCLKEAAFDSEYYEEQTWATSDIRRWLNEGGFDFLAFSATERNKIVSTNITTPNNSEYGTTGGNNTQDKIFLLSIEEAERYFTSDNDRKALVTDSHTFDSVTQPYTCSWWLRSNGYNDDKSSVFYDSYAACVDASGRVNYKGEIVKYDAGIRPAMWIDISSYN